MDTSNKASRLPATYPQKGGTRRGGGSSAGAVSGDEVLTLRRPRENRETRHLCMNDIVCSLDFDS